MNPEQASFARLIAKQFPGARLVGVCALEGGISTRATLVEFQSADGERQKAVVRRRGTDRSEWSVKAAEREFRLLQRLHSLGLPVQRPLGLDTSCESLDAPCVILEFIDGCVLPAAPGALEVGRPMGVMLRRIHDVDADSSELDFLPHQSEVLRQWLDAPAHAPDELLLEGRIRRALSAGSPAGMASARSLLHADFWIGNLVWRDERIVGVLDWEDGHLGVPASDLGKCRLELLLAFGRDAMNALMEGYSASERTGLEDLAYWDLWGALRLIRFAQWAHDAEQLATWRQRFEGFVEDAIRGLKQAN